MEQYLALIQDNIRPGIVKPKIDGNVKFEINGNFMMELTCKLFKGTDDEDAHKHVRRVLEIVDLFHFTGVPHDAVMLRVFPITLSGPALRWKNRISEGLITTWDLLEKVFIRQYCPPFKTAMKLEKNWQFQTRDHSHNWYDGVTTMESINDSSDNVDMKKLKENIHAIQVDCKICKGTHLTKECPFKKEDKAVEQSKYIGSLEETIIKYCDESIKKQAVKADQLTRMVLTNAGERVKAETNMGHLKKQKDNPYKTHETVGIPEKFHKKSP
ncbi:RNA-directed DNA polymerase, eukaryota, nucleotide-binding alpha-beta plait domain protein [Tanacetum coccineum]|uniref:RNA-directed DNA polymerase, eukaryota, nucleotide-binding alpha-beta plait domain protein n=1 Tax=Tanacetum coccineum TaxID=301880 RepID=A0ABQ5EZU5_9ASTR